MVATHLSDLLNETPHFQADHWTADANSDAVSRNLRNTWPGSDFVFRATRYFSRKIGYPDYTNVTRLDHLASGNPYSIYHIHDISGAVSPLSISLWCKRAPVVWTFHDCSPFTGGCIYPIDCSTYSKNCGKCPQLSAWPMLTTLDHTKAIRHHKISLINKNVSAVVCPSSWIATEAKKSGIREDLIHIIPNAVDTNNFAPHDKLKIRDRHGIPKDAFVVFLGSVNLSNSYKGVQHALHAISHFGSEIDVLLLGNNRPSHLPGGPRYHFFDFTLNRSTLAEYYAACDVLLLPSLAENFPLMLLESMASGTPAIAFATGGIAEAVEHMESGWLCPTGDTNSLIEGLEFSFRNPKHRNLWSVKARKTVLSRYTTDRFLDAHTALYEEVLRKRSNP